MKRLIACLFLVACSTSDSESPALSGIYEYSSIYLDGQDYTRGQMQMTFGPGSYFEFRRFSFNQDHTGKYNELFSVSIFTGSFRILGDSLVVNYTTRADSCCDPINYLDISEMPNYRINIQDGTRMRNINANSFEIKVEDNGLVAWHKFTKI